MDKNMPASGKAPGKKGPIRFEAIIPLVIVVGLLTLYVSLFFDMHFRHALEYAATKANGAEVNIGKLKTSLFDASVVVADIEITNPELPSRNRLQIGSVNFSMLWDALLRGKVVINEASINDVQIDMPRKSPGRVLPVKKRDDSGGAGDRLLEQMKQALSGNAIGDLAAIAGGADTKTQLASIGESLKSSAYLDNLQKSLDEKNVQWQSRMAALPKAEDFSVMQRRLANVKLDNLQDMVQIQASLKELESISTDFDVKSKSVSETGAALNGETGSFKASFSGLDQIVKDDVSSLQARMHLPSLDVKTLSRALFGMDVLGKLQHARGYMEQARNYMPAKSKENKPLALDLREKGHDYMFGQPNSYPSFWLRKALISSPMAGGVSGLSGEILDVTSNPAMIGRPMIATVKGDFPQRGIYGVKASLVIDHTTTVPSEHFLMDVAKFSVEGRTLVNSPNVEFGFSGADGTVRFAADISEDNVNVRMNNQFNQIAFETKSESAVVREMMSASIEGLKSVSLNANVTGTWSHLDWQLSTNLADALEIGMHRYLQGKMDDSKARIGNMVNDKIKDQRERLYARQAEVETALKAGIGERQVQIEQLRTGLDSARKKLEERKNSLLGTQQQKLNQESDKLLDNLRIKF